ncbi:MAG: lycopene cyclase domain-containing protein [Calditrichaeota bacterium]|nr:MAG: lycopene cyclase domain-containing protein [Calditrichota bacterium]
MNSEYLIFNLIVLSIPMIFSFEKQVYFYQYWTKVFTASALIAVPFLIWDSLVTHKHWWFNEEFTSAFRIFELPIGEILFFFSIPFACLFIWEVLDTFHKNKIKENLKPINIILLFSSPFGIWIFLQEKEYTGLVLISLSIVSIIDLTTNSKIFQQTKTYLFLSFVILGNLIFNGYLTSRPVVLYDEEFQLGFRIFTIPIEDFGYGFALLLLNVILFEKLKKAKV